MAENKQTTPEQQLLKLIEGQGKPGAEGGGARRCRVKIMVESGNYILIHGDSTVIAPEIIAQAIRVYLEEAGAMAKLSSTRIIQINIRDAT